MEHIPAAIEAKFFTHPRIVLLEALENARDAPAGPARAARGPARAARAGPALPRPATAKGRSAKNWQKSCAQAHAKPVPSPAVLLCLSRPCPRPSMQAPADASRDDAGKRSTSQLQPPRWTSVQLPREFGRHSADGLQHPVDLPTPCREELAGRRRAVVRVPTHSLPHSNRESLARARAYARRSVVWPQKGRP